LVGLAIKAVTKNIGQIADHCNFNAKGTGLSAVAVTALLCSQVCYIQLVFFLSVLILIVLLHDAIRWQVFSEQLFRRKGEAIVSQTRYKLESNQSM
jgi:hypothetical protein